MSRCDPIPSTRAPRPQAGPELNFHRQHSKPPAPDQLPAPGESRRHPTTRPTGLTIRVSSGVGHGRTRLAAFDAALGSAGVADFNLVRLSSVIPAESTVVHVDGSEQLQGGHGDLLYCVYADAYASSTAEWASAGLAWSARPGDGDPGLFVEHTGTSEEAVGRDLGLSIADLSRSRGGAFDERGRLLQSVQHRGAYGCALVIASYATESWEHR